MDYSTRLISQGEVLNMSIPSNTTNTIFKVNDSATMTGTLTVNSTVYNSDARFKQHVRPLTSVLALRGVRYEWKVLGVQHGGTASAGQVGLIAQELEKCTPS